MRGALLAGLTTSHVKGIIPAYAGSTPVFQAVGRDGPLDHPRVCGEHPSFRLTHDVVAGSSPRMRGALKLSEAEALASRIIPAYAGSTTLVTVVITQLMGSSPRMRGARSYHLQITAKGGIIPAYAGSTGSRTTGRPSRRDHPRVCGEHRPQAIQVQYESGSSPRMRGAR